MKILFLLLFCLVSPFVLSYSNGECTGIEPNVTGDWIISVSTNCSNSVIELDGDLFINNSFSLNFSNVTLIINSSDLRSFWIYNNGSFYVNGSNITASAYDLDSNYGWMNYDESLLILENSDISYVGRGGGENSAIEIRGNNSVVRGNNISYVNVAVYLTSFGSIVEGNNIITNYSASSSRGIFLDGCSGNVSNNVIHAPYGVYAHGDLGSNISNNVIFASHGITVTNANNTFLENNTLRDLTGYYGIYAIFLDSSDYITIKDFNISKYNSGIKIDSSSDVVINGSYIEESNSGIYLVDSANNSFFNITIFNSSGEDLTLDFSSKIYCSNYFYGVKNSDGKAVGYYNNSSNISNEEFSQLTLCDADGSNLTNLTINSSQDLKTNNLIFLFSDNCNLDDVSSIYNKQGLVLRYSDDNVIQNSVFNLNEEDGILNYYSDGNVFLNISADLNDFGLSILRSENITINDSTLKENYAGTNGKYDLNIDYFNFSSSNFNHLCSHNINRVNGSNYPLGYFNSQVNVSNEIFSELIICGSSGSIFSNITLMSSGGNLNNILYLSNLTNFEMTNFSIDLLYGGMILHNVNDSNFSYGYVNYSQKNIFLYESHGNIFDNVSSYSARLSGCVLDESSNNVIKNSEVIENLQMGFLVYNNSAGNLIFNNYIKNTINAFVSSSAGDNFWNTTLAAGTNIIGGEYLGGNFWTMVSGNGFSDSCSGSTNGICNEEYNISDGNFDYLVLVDSSEITSCGYEINSGGEYYLSGNLSLGASDFSCINISSDDVSLDCDSFFINGDSNLGYGIFAQNVSGLDVQGCGFYSLGKDSIFLDGVANSTFENIFSSYADGSGLLLVNSSGNSFRNNNFSNSYDDGITIVDSSSNLFLYNEVFNNSLAGFFLNDSHYNNISGGWILNNGADGDSGITIIDSGNNSVFNNVFNNSHNVNVSDASYSDNVWNRSYGNYWGSPNGSGFSDGCVDVDSNGICDLIYNFSTVNALAIDYLPIADASILARTLNINVNYSYWRSGTTNFSGFVDTDLANLANVRFFHDNGKILLRDNIVILRDLDLNGNILVSSNRIYVNSTALPEFNQSAELTLYNITYNVPRILKDGDACSSCDFVSYSNGELVFNVSGFSEYTSDEGSCLDGVQNYGESGVDCGGSCSACDSDDDTSSGGGGGGGTDSVDSADDDSVVELDEDAGDSEGECIENVSCEEWSECFEGFREISCVDLNGCVGNSTLSEKCEEGVASGKSLLVVVLCVLELSAMVLLVRWIYFNLRHSTLSKNLVSSSYNNIN